MKVFFALQGPYEGLRARRLKQVGRLVFFQVFNDGPTYWFVVIKNFSPDLLDVAKGLIDPNGNGTWRFVDLKRAETKFGELAKLPRYVAEEARAVKSREASRQRMLEARCLSRRSRIDGVQETALCLKFKKIRQKFKTGGGLFVRKGWGVRA